MDWIKVEERTPEHEQLCVVFIEGGSYVTATYDDDDSEFMEMEWNDPLYHVKAWLPLETCTL